MMTIDDYINHIKDVLLRIDAMFTGVYVGDDAQAIESIRIQLQFILSHAESGKSFKQGLLERQRYIVKSWFKGCPSKDRELINAIKAIYNDLDYHDYHVGTLSQKASKYYFEFINERRHFHEEHSNDSVEIDEHDISYSLADVLYWDLFAANYYELWIENGIKNLQYFFLVNLFSYVGKTTPAIDQYPHPDALKLTEDIERIAQFYETDEAEGTHMYLNPVKIEEIDGKTHLVDLKGNIVAYPQS